MRWFGAMRVFFRAFGELCLTAGVVILLFAMYLVWGTGIQVGRAQHAFASELNHQWQQERHTGSSRPLPDPIHLVLGKPFAFIEIPRFGRHWRDRKSTRLNSSHVAISYAVFCLKKKNDAL